MEQQRNETREQEQEQQEQIERATEHPMRIFPDTPPPESPTPSPPPSPPTPESPRPSAPPPPEFSPTLSSPSSALVIADDDEDDLLKSPSPPWSPRLDAIDKESPDSPTVSVIDLEEEEEDEEEPIIIYEGSPEVKIVCICTKRARSENSDDEHPKSRRRLEL